MTATVGMIVEGGIVVAIVMMPNEGDIRHEGSGLCKRVDTVETRAIDVPILPTSGHGQETLTLTH